MQTSKSKIPVNQEISTDSYFESQKKVFYNYLNDNVATASMVSKATGIPHKNICRYKSQLQKEDMLWQLYKIKCKVTGHKAWYLTTNEERNQAFINSNVQYNLDL